MRPHRVTRPFCRQTTRPAGLALFVALLGFLGLLTTGPLWADGAAEATSAPQDVENRDPDAEGIEQAVRDYVDAIYDVEPALLERSVHPYLQKVGYGGSPDATSYSEFWMNYYELRDLAAGWNRDGRIDPKTAPKTIRIVDRLNATAVARLDADWGIDHFQLAKIDGRWTIVQVLWQSYPLGEASDSDEEAIRRAAFDYAESAYEVAPELIERSVHPHVQKVGYVQPRDAAADAPFRERWMNFYELKQLVAHWNVDHKRFDPASAKKEVRVLDRLDQTAVARLDAEWGVDYFQLAKIDGRWQIMNVVWQTYPKEATGD